MVQTPTPSALASGPFLARCIRPFSVPRRRQLAVGSENRPALFASTELGTKQTQTEAHVRIIHRRRRSWRPPLPPPAPQIVRPSGLNVRTRFPPAAFGSASTSFPRNLRPSSRVFAPVRSAATAMAEAAIQAALEQGGAIRAAILQEIANAFQPGQTGDLAVKAAVKDETIDAVASALKDPASHLSTLVKDEYDRRADAEFPYRAKLRGLSITDWVAAWRDLVVDQDQVSWTLQAVENNSSLATILALQAANPANAELQELRRASTARYAAKLSWKALCLPSHGGS